MTNTKKINVSLIPLFVLIALILGTGYFLLQGEIKLPKFNKGPTIRRLDGFPTIVYTDKALEKQRTVLVNKDELNTFLNNIDNTGLLILREDIDFNKEFLVAAATQTNEATGHKLKIKKVYEDKEEQKLIVEVEETEMADDCAVELDKNIAVDVVAISKTDWTIEFDRVKKEIPCEDEDSGDTQEEPTDQPSDNNTENPTTE